MTSAIGEQTTGQIAEQPTALDILAPDFRVDSPAVRAAAERHWYAPTELGPAILHYDDCVALLRDRRLRQVGMDLLTRQGISDGPLADYWSTQLLGMEGADHVRLRRLVSRAFTSTVADRLRPRMRSLVHDLADRVTAAGECEFMADIADRYPPRVMFDLLGIPAEEQDQFLVWAKDLALILTMTVAENRERIEAALAGFYDATDRLCADRRRRPGEDLISALVAAADDGERLSGAELRSMVATLVSAGQDTTRLQLGMAVWTFARHPGQWRLLGERPDLAQPAVEEVMRCSPAIPLIWRVATEGIDHRDLHIPAGTQVWPLIGAAHRDPAVYGEAGFDIRVERPVQLTFGHGVHFCLGAALARAELAEALPILAARLPGIELAGEAVFRPELSGVVGPEMLPIRFDRQHSGAGRTGG